MQGNTCKAWWSGWTGPGLLQGQKGLLEPYVFVYAAMRHYSRYMCNGIVRGKKRLGAFPCRSAPKREASD